MEKKYRIQIDGKEMEFETEKEFKQFKKDYNEYEIMINEQFNVGIGTRKPSGGDNTIAEPEITLRDVLVMINSLALEMREGFRKVNERLDKHEAILMHHEEILMRHEEILKRHEEILMRHDKIFKLNNLT